MRSIANYGSYYYYGSSDDVYRRLQWKAHTLTKHIHIDSRKSGSYTIIMTALVRERARAQLNLYI